MSTITIDEALYAGNSLLAKAGVGKSQRSTIKLPPPDFTYGAPSDFSQDCGVKERNYN